MNPDVPGPPKTSEYGHKRPAKMLMAAFAGIVFGFLLQKGGVAKFNVLIGQLLLQDFTVAIVMLTAILVGMVGIFTLHRFGQVQLHRNNQF